MPDSCIHCGKRIATKSTMCIGCYNKTRDLNIPDKDVLSKLIESYTFEHIGRIYGVTGKAVRKWCDKYNIQKKTTYDIPSKEKIIYVLKSTTT